MHKIVPEGYIGLLWKRGKIVQQLGPGRYHYSQLGSQKIDLVDIRVRQLMTPQNDYATSDNLSVRCSLNIGWSITSPTTMVRLTADPLVTIQTLAQDALRAELSNYTLDEVLGQLPTIHANISQQLLNGLAVFGLSLNTLSPLNIVIPRSLRQAYEAEAIARKRAAADMEEARGRTAVLRHLANAASQVEQQPALLQLLMGQKAKHVQFQFTTATPKPKAKSS